MQRDQARVEKTQGGEMGVQPHNHAPTGALGETAAAEANVQA